MLNLLNTSYFKRIYTLNKIILILKGLILISLLICIILMAIGNIFNFNVQPTGLTTCNTYVNLKINTAYTSIMGSATFCIILCTGIIAIQVIYFSCICKKYSKLTKIIDKKQQLQFESIGMFKLTLNKLQIFYITGSITLIIICLIFGKFCSFLLDISNCEQNLSNYIIQILITIINFYSFLVAILILIIIVYQIYYFNTLEKQIIQNQEEIPIQQEIKNNHKYQIPLLSQEIYVYNPQKNRQIGIQYDSIMLKKPVQVSNKDDERYTTNMKPQFADDNLDHNKYGNKKLHSQQKYIEMISRPQVHQKVYTSKDYTQLFEKKKKNQKISQQIQKKQNGQIKYRESQKQHQQYFKSSNYQNKRQQKIPYQNQQNDQRKLKQKIRKMQNVSQMQQIHHMQQMQQMQHKQRIRQMQQIQQMQQMQQIQHKQKMQQIRHKQQIFQNKEKKVQQMKKSQINQNQQVQQKYQVQRQNFQKSSNQDQSIYPQLKTCQQKFIQQPLKKQQQLFSSEQQNPQKKYNQQMKTKLLQQEQQKSPIKQNKTLQVSILSENFQQLQKKTSDPKANNITSPINNIKQKNIQFGLQDQYKSQKLFEQGQRYYQTNSSKAIINEQYNRPDPYEANKSKYRLKHDQQFEQKEQFKEDNFNKKKRSLLQTIRSKYTN